MKDILYKDEKDIIISVEIKQNKNEVRFYFTADCGKFRTDESIAEFTISPRQLLDILNNFDMESWRT